MITKCIERCLRGSPPEPKQLELALGAILSGEAGDAEIGGLLVALRTQPTSGSLLAAGARVLRQHRVAVHPAVRPLIDTCGTGGDGASTFNISTAAALVVAAAGGAVAKHGNRAVSSDVGSGDVLEGLGCRLELTPHAAVGLLDATGFVFLFAPVFHPAMRHVGPARKKLGIHTLFNLLGPLSNPALAEYQVLGVYDAGLTEPMALALRELGSRDALVVHCAGIDELGLHGETVGSRLRDGRIESFRLVPNDVGLEPAPLEALRGGDRAENAALLRAALAGVPGPHSDVVALNAGAALAVAGIADDVRDGVSAALELMRSGRATRVLDRYVESSNRPLRGDPVTGLLEELVLGARARAQDLPRRRSSPAGARPRFADAIAGKERLDVIAEFKRRSPSGGELGSGRELSAQVARYARGGARALSILTEPTRFGGAYADLRLARAAAGDLPLLMKDFVVSARQVEHAARLGASAVLLIARCLPGRRLDRLAHVCRRTGTTPLVECHDHADTRRALRIDGAVLGVNSRDLATLRIDRAHAAALLESIPRQRVVVAESGCATPDQVQAFTGLADAVLVGTALMRSRAPERFLEEVLS